MTPPFSIDQSFRAYLDRRRPEDLGRVFEASAPELLGIGRAMGLDEELAQDALQETFVVLLRRAADFQRERRFLPWAAGIFVRQAQGVRRRAARRMIHGDPRPVPTPHDVAVARETSEALTRAFDDLPLTYRDVVRETLVDGLAPRELAQRHGISANAAAVRVHRGLRLLRRNLAPAIAAVLFSHEADARAIDAVRPAVLTAARRFALRAILLRGAALGLFVVLIVGGLAALAAWSSEPTQDAELVLEDDPPELEAPAEVAEQEETRVAVAPPVEPPEETPAPATRSGRVVYRDGTPAPSGVELVILETDENQGLIPLDAKPRTAAITREGGHFDMPLEVLREVRANGNVPVLFAQHDRDAAWGAIEQNPSAPIELELRPSGRAWFDVSDDEGARVANAEVTLVPLLLPFAPYPTAETAVRGYLKTAGYEHLFHARTDADGNAMIDAIPVNDAATPFYVRVTADGYASTLFISGLVGPQEESNPVVLQREILLTGTIEDATGAPIPTATLLADWRGNDTTPGQLLTRVDGDGEFELTPEQLHAFPIRIRAVAPGFADATASYFVPGEMGSGVLVLRLDPIEPLRGEVVDDAGDAVPGARVRFANADGIHEMQCDADGRFVFEGLRQGPGGLWAAPPGDMRLLESERFAVTEGTHDIRLSLPRLPEEGATLHAAVFDVKGDGPVAPERASLWPVDVPGVAGYWPDEALELSEDGVRVAALPQGRWTLFVGAGHQRQGYATFDVETDGLVEIQIEVGGSATLEVRVPDTGKPWKRFGATLQLESPTPTWFDIGDGVMRRSATLGSPSGSLRFPNLVPGLWRARLVSKWECADVDVVLAANETTVLDPFTEAAGNLLLSFPAPEVAVRLVLEISRDTGRTWRPYLNANIEPGDSRMRSVSLPPGPVRWRVRLLHPRRRESEAEIFLPVEGAANLVTGEYQRAMFTFERGR